MECGILTYSNLSKTRHGYYIISILEMWSISPIKLKKLQEVSFPTPKGKLCFVALFPDVTRKSKFHLLRLQMLSTL